MRLWTLHPKYLDAKGLVALWREGLLAKKVLENKTKGYRNHPQLNRFKESHHPQNYIEAYLHFVCDEAGVRGYNFDRTKLGPRRKLKVQITVRRGQVDYEWKHLMGKLKTRSPKDYKKAQAVSRPQILPMFKKVAGGIEDWEVYQWSDAGPRKS